MIPSVKIRTVGFVIEELGCVQFPGLIHTLSVKRFLFLKFKLITQCFIIPFCVIFCIF